jgi:thiamine-phosphate pyrophosphorylase
MEGLYAIVDVPHPHGLSAAEVTAAVLPRDGEPGAGAVQLRAKSAATPERVQLLRTMAPLCRAAGVPLLVNDDLEAGIEAADGVHLGQDDPGADDLEAVRVAAAARGRARFFVGLSTHNREQLLRALQQRPDYVAMGPVAPTRSKANPDPAVGLPGLLEACRLTTRPLVAIGGLDGETGAAAIELGASAVAVISALADASPAKIRERARSLAIAFADAARPIPFDEVVAAIPVLPPEQLADIARWSDDLGLHVTLGLPARFRPRVEGDTILYRRRDVLDLAWALGKRPGESWASWTERLDRDDAPAHPLVQLRPR